MATTDEKKNGSKGAARISWEYCKEARVENSAQHSKKRREIPWFRVSSETWESCEEGKHGLRGGANLLLGHLESPQSPPLVSSLSHGWPWQGWRVCLSRCVPSWPWTHRQAQSVASRIGVFSKWRVFVRFCESEGDSVLPRPTLLVDGGLRCLNPAHVLVYTLVGELHASCCRSCACWIVLECIYE